MKTCEYCGASIDEYAERCPCCGAPALKEEKPAEPQKPQPAPPQPKVDVPQSDEYDADVAKVNRAYTWWAFVFIVVVTILISKSL